MIGRTNAISGTTQSKPDTLIRFYDYDGELLFGYTQEEIQEMAALPEAPIHENLTFKGWTKTLEALKAYPYSIGVYPKYEVTDGKTYIWITLFDSSKAPTLWWSQTKANGVEIDWGDGTAKQRVSTVGNVSKAHTYSGIGSYLITITPDDDCTWTPATGAANNQTLLGAYKNNATQIWLGKNVGTIPAYAFYQFSNVKNILFPEGITSIGSNACLGCHNLKSLVIPSTVTTIVTSAFADCYSLKQLDIPDTVTTINGTAFTNCNGLEKVFIPKTLVNVGTNNTRWLSGAKLTTAGYYGSGKAIEFGWDEAIPNYAFNCNSDLVEVILPPTIKSIGQQAFNSCYSLTNINLPEGLTTIGSSAFQSSGLVEAKLPKSLSLVSSGAFSACYSLKKMEVNSNITTSGISGTGSWNGSPKLRTATPIGGGGDFEFSWDETIIANAFRNSYFENIIIPEGVTLLDGSAFYGCRYLESVEIPNSVKEIKSDCFNTCAALKSVIIPESVKSIGTSIFAGCVNLSEVKVLGITAMTQSIFNGCVNLTHATIGMIGKAVTSADSRAFLNCTQKSLVIEVYTTPQYMQTILTNIRNNATNAKIIVRASQATVYDGTEYAAGDVLMISEVTA